MPSTSPPMFSAVQKRSLADAVFEQLSERIFQGVLESGRELPAERILAEQLGINRGAVREGLKRLQQAGLVAVRHGGATQVLDWRTSAGLEVLPRLLVDGRGQINVQAVQGIMALRSTLAPAVAAAAARKGGVKLADELDARLKSLGEAADAAQRQVQALAYWSSLVAASANIAYQLAFNSMDRTYRQIWHLLTQVMDVEFRDTANLTALSRAVRVRDAAAAASHAAAHVALGEAALNKLLNTLNRNRST